MEKNKQSLITVVNRGTEGSSNFISLKHDGLCSKFEMLWSVLSKPGIRWELETETLHKVLHIVVLLYAYYREIHLKGEYPNRSPVFGPERCTGILMGNSLWTKKNSMHSGQFPGWYSKQVPYYLKQKALSLQQLAWCIECNQLNLLLAYSLECGVEIWTNLCICLSKSIINLPSNIYQHHNKTSSLTEYTAAGENQNI